MVVPYGRPVRDGHVAFVASGGNCPGLQQLVEEAYAAVKRADEDRRFFGLRGGLIGALKGDDASLVEVTEANLVPKSSFDPPVVSFGKGGPGHDPDTTAKVVRFFLRNGVRYLVYWGGNVSLSVAGSIYKAAEKIAAEEGEENRLSLVCLPKSVDNDAHLPPQYSSIGFMTAARALSTQLTDLATDARNSENLVHAPVLHGNQVGFLTERASRLSLTPLYIVPEMLDQNTSFEFMIDIIVGSVLKRAAQAQPAYHHMVPVAEGVLGKFNPDSCPGLRAALVGRSEGIAANKFPLCERIHDALEPRLKQFLPGVSTRCRSDYYGYTARGSSVLHETDRLMTRVLGEAAVAALLQGQSGVVVIGNSRDAQIITLEQMNGNGNGIERVLDPKELAVLQHWHRSRDVRLLPSDLEMGSPRLAKMAQNANMEPQAFRDHFMPVAIWGTRFE